METFPFRLEDNRIFVDVSVNGQGSFSFLLDTGSSGETVTATLAAKLKLHRVGHGATDGAGESTSSYKTVHLDALSLGKIDFGAMDVPALDVGGLSRAIGFQHFDGVLGADLFLQHVVTIDAEKKCLTVEDAKPAAAKDGDVVVPMTLNSDQAPVVMATINGIEGRFIVDTGDRSSVTLFGPFWRAQRFDRKLGKTVTVMTGYGIGGPIMGIVGRPASFRLGGIDLPAPVTRLSLQKAGVFTSADYAGSIGMGVLRRFITTFDYAAKTMTLRRNSGFFYADTYDRSGLWFGLDEDGLVRVIDVVEDGRAARAGLRAGDRVFSISGTVADAAHLFALRAMLKDPSATTADFHLVRGPASTSTTLLIDLTLADLIDPPR